MCLKNNCGSCKNFSVNIEIITNETKNLLYTEPPSFLPFCRCANIPRFVFDVEMRNSTLTSSHICADLSDCVCTKWRKILINRSKQGIVDVRAAFLNPQIHMQIFQIYFMESVVDVRNICHFCLQLLETINYNFYHIQKISELALLKDTFLSF